MKKITLSLAILILVLVSCNKKEENKPEVAEKVASKIMLGEIKEIISGPNSDAVVDFKFTLNGKSTTFYEYTKDKKVVLNFWGTWCPPCRAELPDLVELSKSGKDFLVVGISLENDPYPKQKTNVKTFLENNNIPYLDLIGENQVIGALVEAYGGITGVPTTFFLDKNKKIQSNHVGGLTKDGFETYINGIK